jgi:hypothetical protein
MTKPDHDFVAVRLDDATQARIDALVPRFSKNWPVTSSDVMRALLELALDEAEKDPEKFAVLHHAKR